MALRSRSFGFAEAVPKCIAIHAARLRMARPGGEDGWLTPECVVVDTTTQETL